MKNKKKVYCKDCEYHASATWTWQSEVRRITPYYTPPPLRADITEIKIPDDCTEPHGIYLDTPLERVLIKNCHTKNKNNNCKYYKKRRNRNETRR